MEEDFVTHDPRSYNLLESSEFTISRAQSSSNRIVNLSRGSNYFKKENLTPKYLLKIKRLGYKINI
ncbi:MAG: hypothetical protein Q7S27_07480 [Nanoarchaeota archaeon]|nr:hypothetical protein [Nanoarchaeota archaeon]